MDVQSLQTDLEADILRNDAATLHRFGYEQELSRRMSGFGNFALTFMTIGVFGSVCLSFQQGLSTAGMFGLSAMWVVGCVIAAATAASLGEISSAIPTAGGLYHWSTILGGRGWGWATAWINLLAYGFSVAGAAVITYIGFTQMFLGWALHIDTSNWGYFGQAIGVGLIFLSWSIINHMGVRLLSHISEIGAYVTLVGAIAFIIVLVINFHLDNVSQIFAFTNYTGALGGNVAPRTSNNVLILGYAVLLPLWIITSYDASAHTAEETVDAAHAVPRAIVNSVLLSAVVGVLLLLALEMAMRNPAEIASQGGNAFSKLFAELDAPPVVKSSICGAIVIAQFVCGLCCHTGFSRAVFAFSRDDGIPLFFRRVSARFKTPANAIWGSALVGYLATLYSPSLSALAAGGALFYQLCYSMAILAAIYAKDREYGPYRLGVWSKPLGILSMIGGIFVLWVGLQPPTEVLRTYFIAAFSFLIIAWFGLERRRFVGPDLRDHGPDCDYKNSHK